MSRNGQEIKRVRQARRILERMRSRLLRPNFDSLSQSASDLGVAVECLEQLDLSRNSNIWRTATRAHIESEVTELRRVVQAVEDLLNNAGRLYAGMAQLLAPDQAPANYTATGTNPGAPVTGGSVEVRG